MKPALDQSIPKVMASSNQNKNYSSKVLHSPIRLLKRIKWVGSQFVLHFIDASYDLFRYLRYANTVSQSSDDTQKLESQLFFYYHKIEKALALPIVKPLFGLDYIETTLDLAEKWAEQTGDLEAIVFRGAYAALDSYQKHVAGLLSQTRPSTAKRLGLFLEKYARADLDTGFGGTVLISKNETEETNQTMDFESFINQRHSVRNFIERPIPDTTIVHAVKLARRTPSVCNRQCWRVHVFTSSADKVRVLQHQNGNEGFGHLADRVLLITGDLRSFLSSGERHQVSVDSGMFAMTLILALEAEGVASCCLNLCLSAFQDIAFRRTCKLSEFENPIMLIVIGYPPENLQVAVSARKTTESILTFRDLEHNDGMHPEKQSTHSMPHRGG